VGRLSRYSDGLGALRTVRGVSLPSNEYRVHLLGAARDQGL
jgi:hypothetical protein